MNRLLQLTALMLTAAAMSQAQEVGVSAAIEKRDAYVGEGVVLQITVRGDDEPESIDIAKTDDFKVEALGGRKNNSESVTIVNGRMSRNVMRGYVFQYRLTPTRPGTLTVPSVTVKVAGRTYATPQGTLTAKKPGETDDFKLRLHLSKAACYVGEPVALDVTWYIGKDVRSFDLDMPEIPSDAFSVKTPEAQIHQRKNYYRIPVGDQEVIAEKGRGRLEGREFATLAFRRILIPRKPGSYRLGGATITCEGLVGYERRRRRDIFDDFFSDDFFGMGTRGVYERFVIPSNEIALDVRPLPEKGKPAGFSGLVGEYRIEASAAPTEVNVGDPITLTVRVSGPKFLEDLELPPLSQQPELAKDFKIPSDRAPGKIDGNSKVFTQTIRATRPDVKQVPSLELPYFDSGEGKYAVARTDPIPLVVRETKVVTARDAEGLDPVASKTELEAWSEGIAHSYDDLSVLESHEYGLWTIVVEPAWIAAAWGPQAVYLVLMIAVKIHRKRHADPAALRTRKAFGELRRALKAVRSAGRDDACGEVLAAVREYLGAKCGLEPGAVTFADVRPLLGERGASQELLGRLRALFDSCETARYSGGNSADKDTDDLISEAQAVAKEIEGHL